jgi:hypothetical protein
MCSILIIQLQTQGYYPQIELDDLKDSPASEGVALDMKNSQRYFESRAINEEDTSNRQKAGRGTGCKKIVTKTRPG